MAEGLLRKFYGAKYDVFSAGTEVSEVNTYAIKVMKEIGIDISSHRSKNLGEFENQEFNYVITVCDNAHKTCPIFPGTKENIHKSFHDPSTFNGTEEDILQTFRKSRDEIKEWIIQFFKS
jgi:arsenate reductase